jgi:hypothetical protein
MIEFIGGVAVGFMLTILWVAASLPRILDRQLAPGYVKTRTAYYLVIKRPLPESEEAGS